MSNQEAALENPPDHPLEKDDFPTEARLCSPQRAAQLLDVSRRTIYVLMENGDLPSINVGRLRRIPVAGIVSYIDRQCHLSAEVITKQAPTTTPADHEHSLAGMTLL